MPVALSISEVRLGGQKTFTVIVRDLTETKRAELQRQEHAALRAEQMSKVAQVATGLAHELRNPLTSIKMLVQSNTSEAKLRQMPTEDLQIIEHEIRRMESSLNAFLEYARPPKPSITRLKLSSVVDRTIALIEGRAANQHVLLRRVQVPGDPVVKVDPGQIQQLLLNLSLNALETMPDGGTLDLELESAVDGRIDLRVLDSGPEIPPDVLPRLFTPFMATRVTGIGLGLVISRRIAEDHGGSLTARNRPEGGACFELNLPVLSA